MSQNNNAPAKKATLSPIIPVALLLIGLVIMSVCYFNVNGRLNTALEEKFAAEQALAAANEVVAEMDLALTTANEALAAKEAELAETTATQDAALATLDQVLEMLNGLGAEQ